MADIALRIRAATFIICAKATIARTRIRDHYEEQLGQCAPTMSINSR